MRAAGVRVERALAVGGGARTRLWPQILSDVTGMPQHLTAQSVGACFGAAYLAARTVAPVSIEDWNPVVERIEPRADLAARYDALYADFRELYESTTALAHRLAERQRDHG